MAKLLRKMGAVDFRPGVWFEASKFAKYVDAKPFNALVARVEAEVDGFEWAW